MSNQPGAVQEFFLLSRTLGLLLAGSEQQSRDDRAGYKQQGWKLSDGAHSIGPVCW
ncbi:MAG: hypothetical protein NTV08_17560 [Verrucomicrobia bacterium]|nr:hypothetical protein [Verrucomicrobiota bacterium]